MWERRGSVPLASWSPEAQRAATALISWDAVELETLDGLTSDDLFILLLPASLLPSMLATRLGRLNLKCAGGR